MEPIWVVVGKPSGPNDQYQAGDEVTIYGPLTPEEAQ